MELHTYIASKLSVAIHLYPASHTAKVFLNQISFGGGRYLQSQLSE